ncbi:hypothetical protein KR093_008912 [Drosophila rubida]|uniref:Transcription factor Ouib n=1 Tax=Drosophila rubida TaxID=30044 RepID=A0AAD4PH19_9MUSC|nr:hypothetical protein KR093_008912 [Drosophila rubida]
MSHLILCRTCGEKIYSLNAKNLFGPEGKIFLKQIHTLTGIYLTEDPALPNHICICCRLDLNHSITFRERCIHTNMYLRRGKTGTTTDPLTTENAKIVKSVPQTYRTLSEQRRKEMEISRMQKKQNQTQQLSNSLAEIRKNLIIAQSESVVSNGYKLNLDRRNARTADNKTYVCDQCGRCFADASNLKIHIVRHTGVKAFECKECGKKYYTGHLLNLHIRVRHQGEMPYACKHCNQRFYTSTARCRHEQSHVEYLETSTKELTFSCTLCGKVFVNKSTLAKHAIVHTGEQPFYCEICYIYFNRKSSLQTHFRSKAHQSKATSKLDETGVDSD